MLSGGKQHELADYAIPGTPCRAAGAAHRCVEILRGTPEAPAPQAPPPFALEPTVSLNTVPPSPPREVLEEMARAAQTYEALSAQGRELRFARDEQSGRTRVEVRDRAGNVLRTLTQAQALALAAGTPLE